MNEQADSSEHQDKEPQPPSLGEKIVETTSNWRDQLRQTASELNERNVSLLSYYTNRVTSNMVVEVSNIVGAPAAVEEGLQYIREKMSKSETEETK